MWAAHECLDIAENDDDSERVIQASRSKRNHLRLEPFEAHTYTHYTQQTPKLVLRPNQEMFAIWQSHGEALLAVIA